MIGSKETGNSWQIGEEKVGRGINNGNTTLTELETWKCRIIVHINPRISLGFPSAMSSFLMLTSLT